LDLQISEARLLEILKLHRENTSDDLEALSVELGRNGDDDLEAKAGSPVLPSIISMMRVSSDGRGSRVRRLGLFRNGK